MTGHVFVIRGDVRHLRCDARLVPVYTEHIPKPHWLVGAEADLVKPRPAAPPGWPASLRTYRLGAAADGGPNLWVTQVGLDAHRGIDWAMASTKSYLAAAFEHLQSTPRPVAKRTLPLLALHLVASGKHNAPYSLGELTHRLLDVVGGFVAANLADVVIVVQDATEYAALQAARLRRASSWSSLPQSAVPVADRLAEEALRGDLCVLSGAGISMGAGIPGWYGLLARLAERANIPAAKRTEILAEEDPLQQASDVLEHYSGRESLNKEIAAICQAPRIALSHAFLANLPVREYVTLNYDTLFEQAAADAGRRLDVLPRGAHGKAKDSWLLKLHGCNTVPRDIVLTDDDYDTYDERRAAFAGIVQSLLVTRHMLFVGFGLTDPNISRLLRSVERALRGYNVPPKGLGTVLTLGNSGANSRRWDKRFQVEALRTDAPDGGDVGARARVLEILLDRVAACSSAVHAHLLDSRFDGLLDERERAARQLVERFAHDLLAQAGETSAAKHIVGALREMGLTTK